MIAGDAVGAAMDERELALLVWLLGIGVGEPGVGVDVAAAVAALIVGGAALGGLAVGVVEVAAALASIWKLSQTISVRYFFSPVLRSSQERVWMRPST